jgi:shikimate dehydrogenase
VQQKKLYGLVGYPLGHSFSKQFFSEKFEREGLADCAYELFPLADIAALPALLEAHPHLQGLNVTIPYKEKILPFVHRLSPVVEAVGATNTIHIRNGVHTAYNTDVIGFEQSLVPGLQSHHDRALVLGTGGASRAAQYVLRQLGIAYQLVGRQPAPDQITYGQLDADLMASHTLIVNCTPVGMSPNDTAFPAIPYEHLSSRHYLYDMVYKPAETCFLQKGKAQGAQIKNGLDMLFIQAEASWKIWKEEG